MPKTKEFLESDDDLSSDEAVSSMCFFILIKIIVLKKNI
jgi:hypothetical protein